VDEAVRLAVAALGIGAALASAPGPVQAVIVSEASRGGLPRGFAAMAGASATFALLLTLVALGVAVAPPTGAALGVLRICGGVVLLWLARDGLHSGLAVQQAAPHRRCRRFGGERSP
jgi:threonine/homoserine/homoserine lactone efflux protein